MVEMARTFRGAEPHDVPGLPVNVAANERIFAVLQPVALFEPRVMGGSWQGGSSGLSVRVPGTRSMRYRIGQSRGHYVRGAETPTQLDTGSIAITDRRAFFVGPKHNREWLWSKCLAIQHRDDANWTVISVSNRQRASGVVYGQDIARDLRFRVDLAFAVFAGSTEQLVAELEQDLRHLTESQPSGAPRGLFAGAADATSTSPGAELRVSTASAPPGWYADPSGRNQLRYFDGAAWTRHVSNDGVVARDPPR
jgi:hypothetical protein